MILYFRIAEGMMAAGVEEEKREVKEGARKPPLYFCLVLFPPW
jgi:hypothetical protein